MIKEVEEMARIIAFDLCPYGKLHAKLYENRAKCASNDNFAECTKINKVVEKLYNAGYRKLPEDSVSTSQKEVFDILDKMEFFQGQRAGRELWLDKPKEVQDKDIADFVRDINYIRDYLKDSVVLSKEEYEELQVGKDFDYGYHEGYKNTEAYYENFKLPKERKETAEKIICLIKTFCPDKNFIETITRIISERFGVEIKE